MQFIPVPFLVFLLIVAFVLASGLKIASEHERFAVFRLGRFFGFRGPGLAYKLMYIEKWVKIKPGDRGELMDNGLAKIHEVDVPVQVDGKASIGQVIRVKGFQGDQLWVTPDSFQGRTVVCQKCGHVNQI